ncbi:uncharacterized protein [Mobula birostris]|uniref:uncharacterized protein n=1 Tax=Mobula birostris TaxID=1983395 RepID=UPI003B2830E9
MKGPCGDTVSLSAKPNIVTHCSLLPIYRIDVLTGMGQQERRLLFHITVAKSHAGAKINCSKGGSKLLEISSIEEEVCDRPQVLSCSPLHLNEAHRQPGEHAFETDVFPGVGQQERRLLFHIDGGKISRWSEAKIFEVRLKAAGNELNRGKDEPDVSYAELNVKTLSAPRVRTGGDDLTSTYSELNFRKEEPRIDEDEDPPIPSGPAGLPTTAQTGPHKQESNENIGNRPYRKICLLCLVTSILVAIVAGLSIHVSQTRQSLITCDGNYRRLWDQHHEMNRTQHQYQQQVRELNSTLQSRTSENSRLDLSQRNCLKNLSVLSNNRSNLENNFTVLNSELSELNQTHTDLRHECNQLETKYRTISENKAQICQYLNRRRGETTSPRNPAPHHWGGGGERRGERESLPPSLDPGECDGTVWSEFHSVSDPGMV